jgi:hypothetical protein
VPTCLPATSVSSDTGALMAVKEVRFSVSARIELRALQTEVDMMRSVTAPLREARVVLCVHAR